MRCGAGCSEWPAAALRQWCAQCHPICCTVSFLHSIIYGSVFQCHNIGRIERTLFHELGNVVDMINILIRRVHRPAARRKFSATLCTNRMSSLEFHVAEMRPPSSAGKPTQCTNEQPVTKAVPCKVPVMSAKSFGRIVMARTSSQED